MNSTRKIAKIPSRVLKTTGNIVKDLTFGLSNTIGGTTNGLEIIVNEVGNILKTTSKNIESVSTQVFPKIGNLTLQTSKGLGNIVKIVPLIGKLMAYIISGSGKGVYHVVISVGNLVGNTAKTVGKMSKETTDLIVFTMSTTSDLTEKLIKQVGKTINKIVNNKKAKKTLKR